MSQTPGWRRGLERDWRDPAQLAPVLLALLSVPLAVRGWRDTHTPSGAAVGVVGMLVAWGLLQGRRLKITGVGVAMVVLAAAHAGWLTEHVTLTWLAIVAVGWTLTAPQPAPAPTHGYERRLVWSLVDATPGDTLAPFALRSDKAHLVSPDGRAAVAYRVLWGTAVASGDPVGAPDAHESAITAFCEEAYASGWRTAVLGASERTLPMWRTAGLRAVPIGRDVVIEPASFSLQGRQFRNLRQAVARAGNAGVTTAIVPENELDGPLLAELRAVVARTGRSLQPRGFAMILDRLLEGFHPGTFLAVARDHTGAIVAFQRFATADGGRELTLDVPYRLTGAPNGTDERLAVEVIHWGEQRGAARVSLAFAPFPELFGVTKRGLLQGVAFHAIHVLDPLIRLESLYRYLRKFHAFEGRRYVVLRPLQVLPVAVTLLWLEFGTRPRLRWRRRAS